MNDTHTPPNPRLAQPHAHDHEDMAHFQAHVRKYILVFVALIIGTVLTVAVSYAPISSVALTIAIALFIACVKGFLVAGYFMHLMSEKKMIYGILLTTVFFFAGLMFLTVWSMHPNSLIHIAH